MDDTLAPGCYKSIRINAGGKLTLTGGGAEYFVTGETRLLNGATLIGGIGLPAATPVVNLKGILITEYNITLNNLLVQSQNTGGQAINIFNNALIQDTVLVTLGNLHPHTGGQLRGTPSWWPISSSTFSQSRTCPVLRCWSASAPPAASSRSNPRHRLARR